MKAHIFSIGLISLALVGCATGYEETQVDELPVRNYVAKPGTEPQIEKSENVEREIGADASVDSYPVNAKPGECYSKVTLPARYANRQVRVVKADASERVEVIPARYRWVDKRIEVQPPTTKIKKIPARYGLVSERILVAEAYTKWEEKPNALGVMEMCRVEVPAEYRTVQKKVLKTPAQTKRETVPGVYKTVRVKEKVSDETTRSVKVPASYQTVTQRVKTRDSEIKWSRILCNKNANNKTIRRVQSSLKRLGYFKNKIDGVIGRDTMKAVDKFQRDNNLAQGALTFETVRALGIRT